MRRCYVTLTLLLCAAPLHGQTSAGNWDRFLPHIHYFRPLIADVQEARMALGLMQTDLFERAPDGAERPPFSLPDPEDSNTDVDAFAGIGGSLPLWHFKKWPGHGGVVASAQLGVFARFRIEYPTREDAGQDWYVGMPIEFSYDKWAGRVRIMHRSSHLGDELIEISHARRIEFGGEFLDFILARTLFDDVRVYGGATYNFRSYTEYLPALRVRGWHDDLATQAGVDATWYKWSNGHFGIAAGIDWQSHERTNWRSMFAIAAGPAIKTNTRATRLLARYYHGPSAMGEFFLTPETYWALEWVVDF